jgi:hypothetical protein
MKLFGLAMIGACLLSFRVAAFTFADGTSDVCIARGEVVPEYNAGEGAENLGFTGRTDAVDSGYRILWNVKKLESLPPAMHDFLFFHECAHAQLPTRDELKANCAGLKAMRAAGRAGFAVETRIAAFYGPASDYWARTLKCANEGAIPPAVGSRPPG